MPRIQNYTRQIEPAALPSVRRSPQRTTQLEAPLLRVTPDTGAEKLGNTLAKLGTATYGEAQLQSAEERLLQQRAMALAQKQQDEERVSVAERDFVSQQQIRMDDPQIGWRNTRQGNDARGLPDEAKKFSDELYDKVSKGLNPRQQPMFAEKARRHQDNFDLDVMRYTSGEITKAETANSAALVDLEMRGVMAGAHDPHRVADGVAAVDGELERFGTSHGQTQPTIDNKKAQKHSDLWDGVIRRLMVDSQDPKNPMREMSLPFAKAYFEAHGDEIEVNKRNELKTRLDVTVNESAAAQYAAAAVQDNGPHNDATPWEEDKILEPLRKKFATSDPTLYKAIKTQVEDLGKTRAESVKARSDYRDGTVQKAIIDGVSLSQLVAMPEFQMLPPSKQADRKNQILERNHTFEQRARSTEEYFRTRGRQARTEARDIKRDEKAAADEKAHALYYDLSQPDALIKMGEAEIYAWGQELGRENMNALLKERKDLIEGKPKIDLNTLYQKANDHGFFPYAQKKTDQQKADLGALQKYVQDKYTAEPVKAGEKISPARQEQIMEEALIEIVTEPGWFSDTKKTKALIGLKDIAPAEQRRLKDRIMLDKMQRGASVFVSDQDIIDLFIAEKEQAQRAR